jgi:hypothetical protein
MKCPCEQCISFAICYAKIRELEIPDVVKYSAKRGCRDLRNYVYGMVKGRVAITRLLFGLPKKKPRKPKS